MRIFFGLFVFSVFLVPYVETFGPLVTALDSFLDFMRNSLGAPPKSSEKPRIVEMRQYPHGPQLKKDQNVRPPENYPVKGVKDILQLSIFSAIVIINLFAFFE
ncbi:unnamed protein product [Caenorhabditis auriculariae]|uniref:Transmembrane protein n=1 Tax=Caenorhabditis auriculariae TaxID=2777116 RepID=A0A8S1HXL3_9PELO|nr:unnamed protein product [Caenorhabditis auriculariae]